MDYIFQRHRCIAATVSLACLQRILGGSDIDFHHRNHSDTDRFFHDHDESEIKLILIIGNDVCSLVINH